ncbi:hypothetical protein [Parvibaculum sp.]|jgi:hypothetical protein|uniref:hypothetical protein n=1 Tax=Parvibaculum sp. TaxID=2024848 RepID=UPI001B047E22|nr:hypothetical protein [Parvibaculum sp.]MBO6633234.1 hypothetical protein [Parvibaculum sp.]MBO6678016.1 hypothetical protein [Parvibaculum sp.]MBO6683349.1 hypothetical protein [Parvibaculum sp.]MBO6903570.1 hypothetical protein [Parvibaculum sp.]
MAWRVTSGRIAAHVATCAAGAAIVTGAEALLRLAGVPLPFDAEWLWIDFLGIALVIGVVTASFFYKDVEG